MHRMMSFFIAATLLTSAGLAQAEQVNLFKTIEPAPHPHPREWHLQTWKVTMNHEALLSAPESILVNLPETTAGKMQVEPFELRRESTIPNRFGGFTWEGRHAEAVNQSILTTARQRWAGYLYTDEYMHLELRPQNRGYLLIWSDVSYLPVGNMDAHLSISDPNAFHFHGHQPHRNGSTPPSDGGPEQPAPAPSTRNAVTVDVGMLYTWGTSRDLGSGMEAHAIAAIELANAALTNSGVAHRFRMAVAKGIVNDGSGDLILDAERAASRTNTLGVEVRRTMDETGVDIVAILEGQSTPNVTGFCGAAYQLEPDNLSGFRDFAVSVTSMDCVQNFTLTHEMGHNLGQAHNHGDSNNPLTGGLAKGWNSYSHGVQYPGVFHTVMAYPCPNNSCPGVNYVSNPDMMLNGTPLGLPETDAYHSDVRRSLEETMPIVANFGDFVDPGTPTPTPTPNPAENGIFISTDRLSYNPPDTMIVYTRIRNRTARDVPSFLYAAVEIAGQFYFYPSFTTWDASPFAEEEFKSGALTFEEELIAIDLPEPVSQPLTLTWHAVAIEKATGEIFGTLDSQPVELRPTLQFTPTPQPTRIPNSITIEWRLNESCFDGQPTRIRFFDIDRGVVYPNETDYYTLLDGESRVFALSVRRGSRLCYGAESDTGEVWGLGLDGLGSCPRCCTDGDDDDAEYPQVHLVCE